MGLTVKVKAYIDVLANAGLLVGEMEGFAMVGMLVGADKQLLASSGGGFVSGSIQCWNTRCGGFVGGCSEHWMDFLWWVCQWGHP